MVLHFFTQNNTETAVVYFNFLVKNVNKILINKKYINEFPTSGTIFYFLFIIFASCKTDSTICLPIIKRITDTYIV